MEEKEYNPFGSSINKVGRGSSTERDRAEREKLQSNGHRRPLAQPNARAERGEGGKAFFHGMSGSTLKAGWRGSISNARFGHVGLRG